MKMKKTVILVVVAAGLTVAATAQMYGPGMRNDWGPGLGRLLQNEQRAEKLGITEDQLAVVRDLWYDHREAMIPLQAACDGARLEQERLLRVEQPDVDAVMAATEAVGAAKTALEKEQVAFRLKLRETLGDEVCANLMARMERMRERGRKGPDERRKGPGRRGPWGPEDEGFVPPPPEPEAAD